MGAPYMNSLLGKLTRAAPTWVPPHTVESGVVVVWCCTGITACGAARTSWRVAVGYWFAFMGARLPRPRRVGRPSQAVGGTRAGPRLVGPARPPGSVRVRADGGTAGPCGVVRIPRRPLMAPL